MGRVFAIRDELSIGDEHCFDSSTGVWHGCQGLEEFEVGNSFGMSVTNLKIVVNDRFGRRHGPTFAPIKKKGERRLAAGGRQPRRAIYPRTTRHGRPGPKPQLISGFDDIVLKDPLGRFCVMFRGI